MPVRYDDDARTLALSVRDLVEEGAPSGHLVLEVVQTRAARAAAGRAAHVAWQAERASEDEAFRAEVTLKRQVAVGEWTALVWGRVDGLHDVDGRSVVEELKSTALDARRLYGTTAADWPAWVEQLRVYLWMLAQGGSPDPIGRLVLVSLADGARHVLGVPLDREAVDAYVRTRLAALVAARVRRLAWMTSRRARAVPLPHAEWRTGQREIAESIEWNLDAGNAVLVEAPTGIGKTAAAMVGVLRHALRTDRQVFWATAKGTQQAGVVRTAARLAGLDLRSVALLAKEKACLNGVVRCRPDACTYADGYYDKLAARGLPGALADLGAHVDAARLEAVGREVRVCPFELALDLTGETDLVVGDYNYVFEPSVHLRRHFGEDGSRGWVVVADEVHQLVDRARDWFSPRIEVALAREAGARLWTSGPEFGPFVALAQRIEGLVLRTAHGPVGRVAGDLAVAEPPADALRALAAELDAVALDYALLRAERPPSGASDDDPWVTLARQVLRFSAALDERGDETVALVGRAEGAERLQLLCLDPSRHLGPRIARLGGFVGLSATLSPPAFYRDLLGLDAQKLDVVTVGSPFPPKHRKVLVAPRVSTAFRDREKHAEPTARLVSACAEAVPGNVAVYFPSFAMLDDIVGRLAIPGRELVVQRPGMDDALRAEALARLGTGGPPKVLCAVLGGVFAEGIDLPAGALAAVIVVSPALPPVGLERDLLREHYEARYGAGFLYASLVPGMTRVVQAAGRLHRRPEDRGVIVLVDRRFRWRDVAALLPAEWRPSVETDPVPEIRAFFSADR